jgi:hypothetical protein
MHVQVVVSVYNVNVEYLELFHRILSVINCRVVCNSNFSATATKMRLLPHMIQFSKMVSLSS